MNNYFRKLFKRKFVTPAQASSLPDYETSFEQAIRFTESLRFSVQMPLWNHNVELKDLGDFLTPALNAAGVYDLGASARQCLKWCHYLQPFFERQLGMRSWATVGQLWKGDKPIFNPSFEDFRRWIKSGFQLSDFDSEGRSGLNVHTWLTVETGEIIEPTFLSTLATIEPESYKEWLHQIVAGKEMDVLNGHRYFPMIAGKEIIEAIAEKSIVPLLATNTKELHSTFVALVFDPQL